MSYKKGGLGILLFSVFFQFFVPSAYAVQDYQFSAVFVDGQGAPLTTALDIRVSLWDAYDARSTDVDVNGDINTSALHYGGYQTEFTITPDGEGYFVPKTFGFYVFHTSTLPNFPDISTTNFFVQVEFKAQGTPNTNYQIYDFVFDPPFDNMKRLRLVEGISYMTADAGPRTNYNTFTLDANSNAPMAVILQFGETLAKTLKYTIASGIFELNDDLSISGGLTATGTINFQSASVGIGTASPQSALHVADGYYAQFAENNAGAPSAADCDADAELGRLSIDTQNNRLYICLGVSRGWDYASLND